MSGSSYGYGGSYGWPSAFYTAPGGYSTGNYTAAGSTPSYFGSGYDPSYTYSPTTYPGQTAAGSTGSGGTYGAYAGGTGGSSTGMAGGMGFYPGMSNTQAFYPSNMDSRTAMINVQVPANAKLWFEGEKTNQTGANRLFRSPPLEAGQNYSYDVKARWTENGQPVEQNRTVRVRAGEMAQVNFMQQGDRNTANPADRNPADRDRLPADRNPGDRDRNPGDRDRNPGDRNPTDRDRNPANPANPPDRNPTNPG